VQQLVGTKAFTMCRLTRRVGAGNRRLQIPRLALMGWVALVAAIPAEGASPGNMILPAGGATTPDQIDRFSVASQGTTTAPARDWAISLRAGGTLTFTDNVNLAPPGQEKADVVLGLSLPIGLRHQSAHVKLVADYTPTFYQYASSRESDNLQNNLRSLLTVEAVDNFFFVDASANIDQSYVSPLAPRPVSGSNITNNRTQQTILGLSPYIRRENSTGWTYLVRNDNLWNKYSAEGLASSVSNSLSADVKSPPARVRYGFDYTYLRTRDESQPVAYYQQVARVRPILAVTPRLNVSARLGYESNDYVNSYSGVIYGAGVEWAPDARTRLDGFVEHRFFGAGYGLNFNHRTRLTAWRLSATSDAYTAQQQPFKLQPGTTAEVLNDAMRSQIADPVQRQQAVKQLMERAGLPPALTQPYSFYTNQVYHARQVSGSFGLVGKRNTADLTLFWQDNEPITTGGEVLAPGFVGSTPFRQRGVQLSFSHRLSGFSSVSLVSSRTYATEAPGLTSAAQGQLIQDTVRVSLTHQLSPRTDASIGVRWANFDSVSSPYQELALIAVLGHSF
jgi:uncharacterized protein (PEP-CTERM system associated)